MSPFHYGVLLIRRIMESFPLNARCGDDDSNWSWPRRSAQLAHEPLHGLVSTAESITAHHVLPDRHGIAASAQAQFDRFPIRLACAGGRVRSGQLEGRVF